MAFYGYHGVLEEEQRVGQNFFVDIELYLDLKDAGTSDDLALTVDYGNVFRLVERIVRGERFKLIEALAEKICASVLRDHPAVKKVVTEVRKPEAPIEGSFDHAAVRIGRERQEVHG
jgi:dihydroneopterin aldolase